MNKISYCYLLNYYKFNKLFTEYIADEAGIAPEYIINSNITTTIYAQKNITISFRPILFLIIYILFIKKKNFFFYYYNLTLLIKNKLI